MPDVDYSALATEYTSVIENLQAVVRQIAAGEEWRGCGYCGSEEHRPGSCPHNPVDAVRMYEHERVVWRCLHCAATFTRDDVKAAESHFGLTWRMMPVCVANALRDAGVRYQVVEDEDGFGAIVFRLGSSTSEVARA